MTKTKARAVKPRKVWRDPLNNWGELWWKDKPDKLHITPYALIPWATYREMKRDLKEYQDYKSREAKAVLSGKEVRKFLKNYASSQREAMKFNFKVGAKPNYEPVTIDGRVEYVPTPTHKRKGAK